MEAQLERAEAPQLLDMLASRLTRGRRRGKKRPLCDSPRDSVKDRPPLPTAAHAADTASRNRGYAVPKLTPDHPDFAAGTAIQGNSGPSNTTRDKYSTSWAVFTRYCATYNWDPWQFSMELATLFAGYLSKRKGGGPAKMSAYISALNHYYTQRQLGTPWVGGPMSELAKGFEITQALAAQSSGQPQRNGALRVAVPVSVLKTLLAKSELYIDQRQKLAASATLEDIVSRGTATHRLCWCAIFWLMILFGFRADTIGGMTGIDDLRVTPDLCIKFTVRRVKRRNVSDAGVLKPFIRELPAPRSANSLRGKVHSVIKAASELQDSEGNPLMLSLIGTPSQTADRVTKAMQAILPPEDTPDVAQGTFISSHSWRKTGASALASFCSLFQVKRWGMWKTTSSCER
jgi:hypothetical protein